MKDYTDRVAKETRDIAERLARETKESASQLAKDTEIWRVETEVRLSKLEVKMNIIVFLAGTGATTGIAGLVKLLIH